MKKVPDLIEEKKTAIERVEELLDYRLPQSLKPLGSIVLSRAEAQWLVLEWHKLVAKAPVSPDEGD